MDLLPQFSIPWEITHKCNLNCLHCPTDSTKTGLQDEMSFETCLELMNKIEEFGSLALLIEGGEPLAREDGLDIIDNALQRFIVAIYSNGMLITQDKISSLSRTRNLGFIIKLQGASRLTHNSITQTKNSFQETINGIEVLRDAGISTVLSMTLTKMNTHEIEDYVNLAIDYGITKVKFLRYTGAGRGKKHLQQLLPNTIQIRRALDTFSRFQSDLQHTINIDYSFPPTKGNCCGTFFTITPNGTAIPCPYLRLQFGNAVKDSIEEILYRIQALRHLLVGGKCKNCDLTEIYGWRCRGGCRGAAYNISGAIDGPDPGCIVR